MPTARNQRPRFSEQTEHCIAVAKGIAVKEDRLAKLDSLHLIIAAIIKTPETAQKTFEKAGYSWLNAQKACPKLQISESEILTEKQINLVSQLKEVVSKLRAPKAPRDNNGKSKIEAEEFLTLILQNPSIRLRQFLRGVETGKEAKDDSKHRETIAPPFRSFREYLTARKQLWLLRLRAWSAIEKYEDRDDSIKMRRISQKRQDKLLNELSHLEEQITRQAEGSTPTVAALTQITTEYGLLSLQAELADGLFVHELYNILAPFNTPVTVRGLAQMIAPEIYPRNCKNVIEATEGLIEQNVAKISEWDDGSCTMSSRIRLQPGILAELWTHLENDAIDDSDLKAARRQLYQSNSWPL